MRQGLDIDGWGGAPACVAVLHVTRSGSALAALLAELDPAEVCAVLWSGGLGPAKEAEQLDVIRRAGFIPQPCVNGARLEPPFPDGLERALFGLGCFWGAERKFWQTPGVYTTAVGYAAGSVSSPEITSTSLSTGTGFMKCMPTTCCGRCVAAAIVVI